ncbi:MAG: hypothetical protein M3R70_04295 [Actinomycetota bacterium]|nr:hypothetical protein [Actinomycetota bacterium]
MVQRLSLPLVVIVLAAAGGASGSPTSGAIKPKFTSRIVLRPIYTQLAADGPRAAAIAYEEACLGVAWRPGQRGFQSFDTCGNSPRDGFSGTTSVAISGTRMAWLSRVSVSHGTYSDWQIWVRDLRSRKTREVASTYMDAGYGPDLVGISGGGSLFFVPYSDIEPSEPDKSGTYILAPKLGGPGTKRCPGAGHSIVEEPPPARLCLTLANNLDVLATGVGRLLAFDQSASKLVLVRSDGVPIRSYSFPFSISTSGVALTGKALVVLRAADARLDVYDAATGDLQHSWPVPDAGSTPYVQAGGGFAVFFGTGAHLLRLQDGAQAPLQLPRNAAARLTSAGLFAMYRARVRRRRRDVIAFVPAARLDAQLTAALKARRS